LIYFQLGLGVTLGYVFFEYNVGKGEIVFIFAGAIAGIYFATNIED